MTNEEIIKASKLLHDQLESLEKQLQGILHDLELANKTLHPIEQKPFPIIQVLVGLIIFVSLIIYIIL